MTKTAKILISVFAAGALAVAVGFVFKYKSDVRHYKLAYELSYRRALTELVGSVANIDSNLSKSIYAQSPSMLVSIATDIYRHAETAKNALAALPTSDVSLEKTAVFVSQVGDFSLSLARSAARGEEIAAESRASLAAFNPEYPSIGKTDAEAKAPILWPPDANRWLTGKDPEARKD